MSRPEYFEDDLRTAFESELRSSPLIESLTNEDWQRLLRTVHYPLEAGGKRVRPMLACLLAQACGTPATHPALRSCAAALEFIHTYSLVHDDLPCMDNDDVRRGKPTTHKIFGEANALLVGDALLTHAFYLISQATRIGLPPTAAIECVHRLSRCAGVFGMIGGQWKDLACTDQNDSADWYTLCGIHKLKTGALLGAACTLGVVIGLSLREKNKVEDFNHPNIISILKSAEQFGVTVGLAFQIIDDVLDATQNSDNLGKTAGKDAAQNKLTAVKLLGLKKAQTEAQHKTRQALIELENLKNQIAELEKDKAHTTAEILTWKPVSEFVHQLFERTS